MVFGIVMKPSNFMTDSISGGLRVPVLPDVQRKVETRTREELQTGCLAIPSPFATVEEALEEIRQGPPNRAGRR